MSRKGSVCWLAVLIPLVGAYDATAGGVTVTPSIRIEEMYDSNASLGSNGDRGDFLTSVNPRINVAQTRRGIVLNGSYSLNSRYHSHEAGLNYISHTGLLDADVAISEGTSMKIADSISYTRDSREIDAGGIQLPQTGITTNNFSMILDQKLSRLTSIEVKGYDRFSKYEGSGFVNSRVDSAGMSLRRELTPVVAAKLEYSFTNQHFEKDLSQDNNSHYLFISIAKSISPEFAFAVKTGGGYFQGRTDILVWAADVSLFKKDKDSNTMLSYSRGMASYSGLTDEIMVGDRVNLSWSRAVKEFNINIMGSYSETYTEPSSIIRIKSYDAAIRTDWKFNPYLTFGAGCSRFGQWSEGILGNNTTRDQVFISLSAAADNWRF